MQKLSPWQLPRIVMKQELSSVYSNGEMVERWSVGALDRHQCLNVRHHSSVRTTANLNDHALAVVIWFPQNAIGTGPAQNHAIGIFMELRPANWIAF